MGMDNSANLEIIKKRIRLPWKLFITYILSTILINFFGPWSYTNYDWYDKTIVLVYMVCFLLAYSFAYFAGTHFKTMMKSPSLDNNATRMTMLVKIPILIAIIIYCFLLISGLTRIEFDPERALTEIMAQAYTSSRSVDSSEFNIATWIYSYGYIFCFIAMTLGLYKYNQLTFIYRVLLIGVYIGAIANSVLLVGAQKSVGDMIIIVGSVYLIRFARYNTKIKIGQLFAILAIIIGIIFYFASAFSARIALWGIYGSSVWGLAFLDTEHWMLNFLPDELATGVGIFLYYLTHGYYGLSLCLKLPFVWTVGLGSSFAIRDIAGRYLDMESLVANMTYPERMESVNGWGAYANWHTIFPWLASDFTFIGAIAILAFITYIYAICWKESILKDNWISILMFSFLNILFIYVPANNQLFQTKSSLIAFLVLIIMWLNRAHILNLTKDIIKK